MLLVFSFTFRVEEYISRGLEGNIVDPDKSMMYTKQASATSYGHHNHGY